MGGLKWRRQYSSARGYHQPKDRLLARVRGTSDTPVILNYRRKLWLRRIKIDEKIMTLHPGGKTGVNLSRSKYDVVRHALIESLNRPGELTFSLLGDAVQRRIEGDFEGSVSLNYTTVKLDLEARGEIERTGSGSPQRIHLIP